MRIQSFFTWNVKSELTIEFCPISQNPRVIFINSGLLSQSSCSETSDFCDFLEHCYGRKIIFWSFQFLSAFFLLVCGVVLAACSLEHFYFRYIRSRPLFISLICPFQNQHLAHRLWRGKFWLCSEMSTHWSSGLIKTFSFLASPQVWY